MLGLDNPIHIAFVLILLLLVFGAKRLPEMGKSIGAGLRGFKESISGEDHTEHLATTQHLVTESTESHDNETVCPRTHEAGAERTAMQPVA